MLGSGLRRLILGKSGHTPETSAVLIFQAQSSTLQRCLSQLRMIDGASPYEAVFPVPQNAP